MRGTLAIVAVVAVWVVPSVASAQGECPDGWFCEPQTEAGDAPETTTPERAEPAPEPAPTAPEPETARRRSPGKRPTPIVVYPPGEGKTRQVIIVDRPENTVPPPRKRKVREWGLNLRLEGVLMNDEDADDDAGMGGLGLSLRYRPIPYFALDVGVDFIGGTDWAGNERDETALLLSGMVYFNPRSKAQVYTIGGIGFSGARVQREVVIEDEYGTTYDYDEEKYSYFGAHLGLGMEFRVGRKVALNVDVLGFIRGRTDDRAEEEPEFTDPDTGLASNTSGGGLLRGGITFYW